MSHTPRRAALLVGCGAALTLRLWVAKHSIGSNDSFIWEQFAATISEHGVLRTYQLDSWFNHPPLMGYWAKLGAHVASTHQLPFAFVFKLPSIAASVLLLYALFRAVELPWPWLVLLVISPLDVLISSYHGNTDALCVALSTGAILAAMRGRAAWAGAALAAAINVKLIPILLIAPVLLGLPNQRARLRCLLVLSLGAVPFVPVLLYAREAFLQNAIFYNSFRSSWGFGLIALGLEAAFPGPATTLWEQLSALGKPLIVSISTAYPLLLLALERPVSPLKAGAFAFTTFLVIAPGFGVQYLIYPAPLLLLSSPRRGLAYTLVAGCFAALLYYWYWTREFPPASNFDGLPDLNAMLFGFVAWLVLAAFWLRSVQDLGRLFVAKMVHWSHALPPPGHSG